jgi:hypothetical protein
MPAVWSELFQEALVAAANDHTVSGSFSGPLFGSKMGLFTNNIVPTGATLKSDLVLFVTTATPEVAVTWGAAYRRQEGGICTNTGLVLWQLNANTPTLIYGYYIVDTTGAFLYITELFPGGPIQLVDETSAIQVASETAFGGPDDGTCILGN